LTVVSGNLRNAEVTCTTTIVVKDAMAPFIDCHQCQNATDTSNVRLCDVSDNSNITVSRTDLKLYFDEYPKSVTLVAYPGSFKDNKFYNCDCTAEPATGYIIPNHYTKNWGSWGTILAIDTVDSNPNPDYPSTKTSEFQGSIVYKATDAAGNTGSCVLGVTYDKSAPTCNDFINLTVPVDPDNYNYSVPVYFEVDGYNASYLIAGPHLDEDTAGPTLQKEPKTDAVPTSGAVWKIGGNLNATYETTYRVEDRAGNVGNCAWKIMVLNPEPCIFVDGVLTTPDAPNCDDLDPVVSGCPSNITIECGETANIESATCGCGDWTEPTFTDDKFVARIEVSFDGSVEYTVTDNNNPSTNAPNAPLKVGQTTVKYEAFDMHNQSVVCQFIVTITDTVAPTGITGFFAHTDPTTGCPSDRSVSTDAGVNYFTYDYAFSFKDECSLNSNVDYNGGLFGSSFENNITTASDADILLNITDINTGTATYNYYYYISDDENNHAYCHWRVTVTDEEDPEVFCRAGYTARIAQGETSIAANLTTGLSTFSDNVGVVNSFYSPYVDGDRLVAGVYTTTFNASDAQGNSNSCQVNIIILPGFPTVYFKPVLTYVKVSMDTPFGDESGNPNTYLFGAHIKFSTLTNLHHRVKSQPQGITLFSSSNNNANIMDQGTNNGVNAIGSCSSTATLCEQSYEFKAGFDACTASDKKYSFNAAVECTPADCKSPDHNDQFDITLSAANYCWQDLELDTTLDAKMITVPKADADTFATGSGTVTHVGAFNQGDEIAGIISVSHDDLDIKSVALYATTGPQGFKVKKEVYKSYSDSASIYKTYNQNQMTNFVESYTLEPAGDDNVYCGFSYTEDKLTLTDNSLFAIYTANVIVTYDFGATRRMLLQTDSSNDNLQATAEAILRPRSNSNNNNNNVDKNTAIVVMMIDNCDESNNDYSNQLITAIAKYLHIDINRIAVSIDATAEGYCLAEITLQQSSCSGTTGLLTLIEYLEEGVSDELSELHTYFSEDVPEDIILDTNVFFVSQTPQELFESTSVQSNSNTSEGGLEWFYYVVAGALAGMLIVSGIYHTCVSKKADSVKHMPLQGERRYSIADLLAATERRSSIDIANVKLHSAF